MTFTQITSGIGIGFIGFVILRIIEFSIFGEPKYKEKKL